MVDPDCHACKPGESNISEDPLLNDPDYENPEKGDWSSRSGSPCLGAGKGGLNIGLGDPSAIGLSAPEDVGPRPWPFSVWVE